MLLQNNLFASVLYNSVYLKKEIVLYAVLLKMVVLISWEERGRR